jgi:hypothetical protein
MMLMKVTNRNLLPVLIPKRTSRISQLRVTTRCMSTEKLDKSTPEQVKTPNTHLDDNQWAMQEACVPCLVDCNCAQAGHTQLLKPAFPDYCCRCAEVEGDPHCGGGGTSVALVRHVSLCYSTPCNLATHPKCPAPHAVSCAAREGHRAPWHRGVR